MRMRFLFVILAASFLALNCLGDNVTKITSSDCPSPSDTTKITNIDLEHLNNRLKGGVLEGHADLIVEHAKKNGVSPHFLASIIILESNAGKSKLARKNYNFGGLRAKSSKYMKFASIEDGIAYMADLIRRKYHNCNLYSVKSINRKYAADKTWHRKVSAIMNSLHKESV